MGFLATVVAAMILVLTPVLLVMEWRHRKTTTRIYSEISELLEGHRKWLQEEAGRLGEED